MLTTVVNHNIEQPKPQSIRPIIHARLTIYVLGLAQSPLLFARLSLGVRDRILSRTRIFFYYYSRYNLPNSQPIIHDFYIVVMDDQARSPVQTNGCPPPHRQQIRTSWAYNHGVFDFKFGQMITFEPIVPLLQACLDAAIHCVPRPRRQCAMT